MILVTGATGHVGRPLIDALIMQREQVRVLAMEKDVHMDGVEIISGNVLDLDSVKSATEGADTIYHLAAIVDYAPAPEKLMYDVNVNGTKNLLACSKAKKFIYLSTTSVYGHHMRENPASESTTYDPNNFYGKTKMMAEKLVLEKGGIVIRSPVIYGHGFNESMDVVLSQIEKGKMPIIGNGTNLIQWININDLVQALLLAKDNGKPGVYQVAGKEAKTQVELFSLLAKYLNVEPPKKKISETLAYMMADWSAFTAKIKRTTPKLTPEKISRIASSRTFDITKAKAELGFDPKVDYEQGAKELVEDYLSRKQKS